MVSVNVSAAGRPIPLARGLPVVLEIPSKSLETAKIADVKEALAAKFPQVSINLELNNEEMDKFFRVQLYPARQKISIKGEKTLLKDEITLQQAGILDGGELTVKDLGPQISWRTVFIIEYVCAEVLGLLKSCIRPDK